MVGFTLYYACLLERMTFHLYCCDEMEFNLVSHRTRHSRPRWCFHSDCGEDGLIVTVQDRNLVGNLNAA